MNVEWTLYWTPDIQAWFLMGQTERSHTWAYIDGDPSAPPDAKIEALKIEIAECLKRNES
jgi:hypothetical protein